jgi:hypothetical protein
MRETLKTLGLTFLATLWCGSAYMLYSTWNLWDSEGITKDCFALLLAGRLAPASTSLIIFCVTIMLAPIVLSPILLIWRHFRRTN